MRQLWLLFIGVVLSGCAALNEPINGLVVDQPPGDGDDITWANVVDDSTFIGLAFSGGGMRASAWAYGMLQVLDETVAPDNERLTEKVRVVSGVSGGSITAAWFGLRGRDGLEGFRERYLITNAESLMATSPWNPINLARAIGGGVNDRTTFARFLDDVLFDGATFAELASGDLTKTWINATDIASTTPFFFDHETFRALCSDLDALPISEAVAASAGFPVAFSPIVLRAHGPACDYQMPPWLTAALSNQEATSTLRAYAQMLLSYRDPEQVQYVKLLDGGITDNFGTTALSLTRAASRTQYGPLSPEQAVMLKRGLFLVANAGRTVTQDWSRTLAGPSGLALAQSIAESSLESATRASYDVLRLKLDEWEADLIQWRCSLPKAEVLRLRGNMEGWDCADLKFFVGAVGFADLDTDLRKRMNRIPTRLVLTSEEVDLTIAAVRKGMQRNPAFRGFVQSLRGISPVTGAGSTLVAPERVPRASGS